MSWIVEGISYEVDSRHVEVIAAQLQLRETKIVTSPCAREGQANSSDTVSEEMDSEDASKYRMLAARFNYLAPCRPDIQHATKEAGKWMARPHVHHWTFLKRIARCLFGAPRVIQKFHWQRVIYTVIGHVESDWVGDRRSRESTSGGICKVGRHVAKAWSSTQQVVAFSSAEVELYAFLKCA